jgi:hypothetical protein
MYGYGLCATLTTDRLHYKLQTRPLVREASPRPKSKAIFRQRKGKKKDLIMSPKGMPDTKTD